jgi:uncharacterized protein (TIGR02147 family)
MPVIYKYFDHLKFLHDDFSERQARNPQYSLRAMADRLRLNSGTIVRIMNGQRNISTNLLPEFTAYLALRQKEAEYFKLLVNFCQAKTEKIRNESYSALVDLRNGRTKIVGEECHSFYDDWYFTAIRELLRIYTFNGDVKELSRMLNPPISCHEARRALDLLRNLGLLDACEAGFIVREQSISTGEKWQGSAIKRFQQITLSKALEALERFPKEERDFSTMTMCYSQDGFHKVKELLKRTREELSRIEDADMGKNKVYQINVQIFPLSEAVQEGVQ